MSVPTNAVLSAGVGVISADQANTYVQVCTTAPQLRSFIGAANMGVMLLGIAAVNDGSGGFYYWNTGTYTDNNSTAIVPDGVTSGAWIKVGAL